MIIRKPYAFLIKYFKIIHIILFAFMTYLAYKTNNIYLFFRNYVSSGTYNYSENMALQYINIFMIIMCITLITLLLLVYFLMKKKQKKVLYYLLATIFYGLLFIIFLYFLTVFNSLEFSSYSNQSLVLFRDLSMIAYYVNYIFLAVSFIRGFGFNIKKFNFEKDLKELEISEEDQEEIELSSQIDYENIGNYIRKSKRNFGYYVKENSFILIIFLILVVLITSASIAYSKLVVNHIYKEGDVISINNIDYVINNSYIIDKDVTGNIIKNNHSYLILDLSLTNKNSKNISLDMSDSRVKINNKYYYYKSGVASKFNEFGTAYKKQVLKTNTNNNYIIAFEIDNNYNQIMFELYEGKKTNGNKTDFIYKNISLIPYDFAEKNLGDYKLNDLIDLSKTYYQKGKLVITSVDLVDRDEYTYNVCITQNNCKDYTKTIAVNGNKKILKIQYNLDLNKDIFAYLNLKGNIEIKNSNIRDITPDNYTENIVLLEVPNNLTLENLSLQFNIRGTSFNINL